MSPYCSCGVIQVSGSPNIQIGFETGSFTQCFKPKSPLPEVAMLADVAMLTCIPCMPLGESMCAVFVVFPVCACVRGSEEDIRGHLGLKHGLGI